MNVDALAFYSGFPIDKVVFEDTATITNDGNTTSTTGYASSKIVEQTYPNPFGAACFVRFVWSVDNSDFNGSDARLAYGFTFTDSTIPFSQPLGGLRGAVSIGVSDTLITIRTANGYHGDVTFDGVSYSYTPVSQNFTIKYALFSID